MLIVFFYSWIPHYIFLSCLLSFLLAMEVSQTLCLITLAVLRITSQVFCRMPQHCNLSNVFLMIRLELQVFGKKTTEVKCLFITLYQGHSHVTCFMSPTNLDFDRCGEVLFVRLLYCKVTLSIPFVSYFWKDVTMFSLDLGMELCSTSLRRDVFINYL